MQALCPRHREHDADLMFFNRLGQARAELLLDLEPEAGEALDPL
jgi:hypothetical protein